MSFTVRPDAGKGFQQCRFADTGWPVDPDGFTGFDNQFRQVQQIFASRIAYCQIADVQLFVGRSVPFYWRRFLADRFGLLHERCQTVGGGGQFGQFLV